MSTGKPSRLGRDDITEEVRDGVVRDYLRGDKGVVIQLEYNISAPTMYRILRARKVELRERKPGRPGQPEEEVGVAENPTVLRPGRLVDCIHVWDTGGEVRVCVGCGEIRTFPKRKAVRAEKVEVAAKAEEAEAEVEVAEIEAEVEVAEAEETAQEPVPEATPAQEVEAEVPQHPLFVKYRRDYLHEATGYAKGYLCRIATGKISLSRAFIDRVCYNLKLPEDELFLESEDVSERRRSTE